MNIRKKLSTTRITTTSFAMLSVAIMMLMNLSYMVQAEDIYVDVNTDLPFTKEWDDWKIVILHLENVTEEMIIVVIFENVTVEKGNTFNPFGAIDNTNTIFVFNLRSDDNISFEANPGMKMTIYSIERNGIVQGFDEFSIKGETYLQKYGDTHGVMVSVPDTRGYKVTGFSEKESLFFSITDFGLSRYAEGTQINETLPEGTSHFVLRTFYDKSSKFELTVDQHEHVFTTSKYPLPIAIAGMDVTELPNQNITFKSYSLGDIINTTWNFGNGEIDYGNEVNHSYDDDGIYTVTLKVTDSKGEISLDKLNATILNIPPSIEFIAPYNFTEDESVFFEAIASDTPLDLQNLNYTWYFGDSLVLYGENVSRSFDKSIYYDVSVIVMDDDGAIGVATANVMPMNVPPTAVTWNYTVVKREKYTPVEVTGDSFDTPSDYDIMSYLWNFDGWQIFRQDLIRYFEQPGIYTPTLKVTDDDFESDSKQIQIEVINNLPVANAGPDRTVYQGDVVDFNGLQSYDLDNDIVRYIWDFGDGKGSLARVTTHIYNDIGVYYVTLIVIDSYGAISKDECVITVLNELPTPSIEIYQDVNFGLRVTGEKWHKVKLGVLEDGDEIDSLEIIREPGDPDDQSKSFSSHLDIRMRNELKVEFEFFNDSNFHGSNPSWVNISLEGWNETIFYEFNLNDGIYQQKTYEINNILSRGVITFDGSSSYDKDGNILDYLWNFGDGTSSTDPVKEKQYLQDGLYEVLLTVEDDDGAINTYSI